MDLRILLSVLIITVLILNYNLGTITSPLSNTNGQHSLEQTQQLKRYENTLIENFVIDTDLLEQEIEDVTDADTANANANANANSNANSNANANANSKANAINQNIADKVQEAINSQTQLGQNYINNQNTKKYTDNTANNNVNKISNKFIVDDDNIFDMMKKLEDVEVMCSKLDKDQKLKDDLEQIHINKSSLQELDNQEKRIEELSNIVQHLRREKEKRDIISNKCRVKRQDTLDNEYTKVKDLVKKGFLKDESRKIDIKLPEDGIKFNWPKPNNTQSTPKISAGARSCKKKSKDPNSFNLNKLDNGVCHGCNSSILKKDMARINKDFK